MHSSSIPALQPAHPDPGRSPVPGHLRPVLRPRRTPLRHPHLPLPVGTEAPVHHPPAPRRGLRPGGQSPAAQILWRRGLRVAYLYRADLALPKRQATPAQRAAIAKALRARRTCPTCGTEKPYYIPRSLGECLDCTGR